MIYQNNRINKKDKSDAFFFVIRHGSTQLNNADKIRGWLDVPLDEGGKAEAHKMGKQLKNEGVDGLVVSDLKRAIETADIIHEESGIPIFEVSEDYRPWNVGIYTAKKTKDVLPMMEDYARKNPTKALPEGESFQTFVDRFIGGLKHARKEFKNMNIGVVTHHRGDRIFAAWEKEGMPDNEKLDLDIMFQRGIPPGTWRKQGEKIDTSSEDNSQAKIT